MQRPEAVQQQQRSLTGVQPHHPTTTAVRLGADSGTHADLWTGRLTNVSNYIQLILNVHVQIYGQDDSPMVAITAAVGMLPVQPNQFCEHDAPRRVPLECWDVIDFQTISPHSLDAQFGSFLHDVDVFDAAIFGVSR